MENLEGAIQECSSISENDNESIDGLSNEENVEAKMEKCNDDEFIRKDDGNDIWPPDVGQFVFGLFEDGISPGEVKNVMVDSVNIDILVPATVPNMDFRENLWKRPSLTSRNTGNYTC